MKKIAKKMGQQIVVRNQKSDLDLEVCTESEPSRELDGLRNH